jgi:hypothetical protein
MIRLLRAVMGALVGAIAGFALVFYGYLLLHPPSSSGVEFETASPLAFFVGVPLGMALGVVISQLLSRTSKTM